MTEEKLQRTPLYETHLKYGGKIVPFAGWELPVQYKEGVIAEHMAVRTKAGLFDVSHMGEILCEGPDATANLNMLLTNDYTDLAIGEARYSPMCNENGGTVDDLIVYKKGEESYFVVVNAANKDKDYAWMLAHQSGDVRFKDVSANVAQIALQGPLAIGILEKLVPKEMIPAKNYACNFDGVLCDEPVIIATTGYTGEDGVELYMAPEVASKIWEALMTAGEEDGLIPCGLGARDTLRLEAGMPLYGHEMDDTVSPKEAMLGMFVKMDKPDFIGKEALAAGDPPKRKKVGLEVTGRGIIREHMEVFRDGKKIGETTSGTMCPYIKKAVACALVDADARELGEEVEVDVRGRMVPAKMVAARFYKKEDK